MADGKEIGEDAAPETIMEAALASGPLPKQNQPPTILPFVSELPQDVLAKGKGVEGDVFSPSIPEKSIRLVAKSNHIVDLIRRRVAYLESVVGSSRGLQHQPKDIEYAQKIENFIMKMKDSSLDEIVSKEMDLVFLLQFLEDILDIQESSLDARKGGISPDPALAALSINATGLCSTADAQKGGISPDPVLAALAAAPSCHRRGNADELFAPIPYQW